MNLLKKSGSCWIKIENITVLELFTAGDLRNDGPSSIVCFSDVIECEHDLK